MICTQIKILHEFATFLDINASNQFWFPPVECDPINEDLSRTLNERSKTKTHTVKAKESPKSGMYSIFMKGKDRITC